MTTHAVPAIQISKSGTTVGDPTVLERLRADFSSRESVKLAQFLEPALLAYVQGRVRRADFHRHVHPGIGQELEMEADEAVALLHLVLNVPEVFRSIESITGCEPIGCFIGRIYSFRPGHDDAHGWHSDVGFRRLLGLSVNVSEGLFQGGELRIRQAASGRIIHEIANTGAGDAVIFRIAEGLEHRVAPVTGAVSKVACAGWFFARPRRLYDPDTRD